MLACISPPARFHVTEDDVHYHTLYVTHSNSLDSVTPLKYELANSFLPKQRQILSVGSG